MKALRNKTIDFGVKDGEEYLKKCVTVDGDVELADVLNKTVLGDTFKVTGFLPEKFVDLLIVDPPYNLSKNFGGNSFKKQSCEDYAEYTESWIKAILPLLKDTASVYVCCDWESGMTIGNILQKYFIVRNRITWQREKGRGAKANWKNGMEDIWFATVSQDYYFDTESVKIKRKVLAPY